MSPILQVYDANEFEPFGETFLFGFDLFEYSSMPFKLIALYPLANATTQPGDTFPTAFSFLFATIMGGISLLLFLVHNGMMYRAMKKREAVKKFYMVAAVAGALWCDFWVDFTVFTTLQLDSTNEGEGGSGGGGGSEGSTDIISTISAIGGVLAVLGTFYYMFYMVAVVDPEFHETDNCTHFVVACLSFVYFVPVNMVFVLLNHLLDIRYALHGLFHRSICFSRPWSDSSTDVDQVRLGSQEQLKAKPDCYTSCLNCSSK